MRAGSGGALAAGALLAGALLLAILRVRMAPGFVGFGDLPAAAQQGDMAAGIIFYATLPRIAVALLAGGMMALAGVLFQDVLRNPLAEPTTLGVAAGAQLALMAAALYAPALLESGRDGVALAGSAVAVGLVAVLALRQGLSPVTIILAGLVVALLCGALGGMMEILARDHLQAVTLWGTGVLEQNGWDAARGLAARFALLAAGAAFLMRPATLLALDEEAARALGLGLLASRILVLGVATALSACVVSAVGVIGFIGLAAPALARLTGARRLPARMGCACALGAALLLLADQCIQMLPAPLDGLPTGTAVALIGAPVLLWMIAARPQGHAPHVLPPAVGVQVRHPLRRLAILAVLVPLVVALALSAGHGPDGWSLRTGGDLATLLPWRWPRLLAAGSAGVMLAAAGAILQRLTANPLASPEVVGVAPAAGLGMIAVTLLVDAPTADMRLLAATVGSVLALCGILAFARTANAHPERVLLVGVAVGTLFGSLVTALSASGDPRLSGLLSWLAGSTLDVSPREAVRAALLAGILLAMLPLARRWLAILPLGDAVAAAVGLPAGNSRLLLLLYACVLTAAATLVVGPFTFVGLLAPHMARMLGLRSPLAQIAGAALAGALVMMTADALGRSLLFPYEIPAGLVAACIGAPYLLLALSVHAHER